MSAAPSLSGRTRLVPVLAHPVDHVRAPSFYNPAFAAAGLDWLQMPLDVKPERLAAVLAELGQMANVQGINITIPHKGAACRLCQRIGPEARRTGVESFMGLFFPESDIGAPARDLYTQNFSRYIPHIGAPTAKIEPADNPLTNKPIDLSHSVLRAVAPCHVAYLANMGVTASMSFSIVSEGRLWGCSPAITTARAICRSRNG